MFYAASTEKCMVQLIITTSDDPRVKEAMYATPEEQELWKVAIENECLSIEEKDTWDIDDNPETQPLPTHIVLKINRKSDGT